MPNSSHNCHLLTPPPSLSPGAAPSPESMADAFLRPLTHGCIAACDAEVARRPYHKNCGCALHDRACSHAAVSKHSTVSYPIRRAWSESCLAMASDSGGSASSSSSP